MPDPLGVDDGAAAPAGDPWRDAWFLANAVQSTGLLLLVVRHTGAMGLMLAIHLGLVFAFFLVMPYSKMVHGLYRGIALLRHAQEKRRAGPAAAEA